MEVIITKQKDNYRGMEIQFYQLGEFFYLTLPEVIKKLPEDYEELTLSVLERIVSTHIVPKEITYAYPEFKYVDEVSNIPTTYENPDDYQEPQSLINEDRIEVVVVRQLGIHLEILETTYELNNEPYKNIRSMIDVLNEQGYIIKFGELRHAISKLSTERLSERFPNMIIIERRQKRVNASDVKYAIDCKVLSKSGHHTSVVYTPTEHNFLEHYDEPLCMVRESDEEYSLNSEVIGNETELLTKLNLIGIDISKNQFKMIKGHNKVPKSLLSKYPKMTYQSRV